MATIKKEIRLMKINTKIGIFIISCLVAVSLAELGYSTSPSVKPASPGKIAAYAPALPMVMVPANFSDLAEKVKHGVVNVQVNKKVKISGMERFGANPFGEGNPFGDFFGPFRGFGNNVPERKQQGIGSGFIINQDGYILTNNHVIEGADEIKVKLADGKEFKGKVIGGDPKTDLALVRIEAADLKPLQLGNSDDLKVGEWVMAVGSPFGLEQTVTAGIVSAKGRVIGSGPYDNFIQTDASINPGNSGGPLINMKGEVIGINTAIIASGQGIGFAIPINMAKEITPQLQTKGHVTRGLLGVIIQELTPELAKPLGLKESKGALVAQVTPDGPADKAGIKQGDVIVDFDGKQINDSHDLPRVVAATPIGKTVRIKVLRDGKETTLQAEIVEMEDEKQAQKSSVGPQSLGITVQNLTPQIAQKLGLKKSEGVVITEVEPGSPAEEALLQSGDVILSVNRRQVKNVDDFEKSMEKTTKGDTVLLLVQKAEGTLFVAVKLK
jgi:serine protease Do